MLLVSLIKRKSIFSLFIFIVLFLIAGGVVNCNRPRKSDKSGKFLIYVTFTPMWAFTKEIGGKYVDVVCPLPAGVDPAFWVPERNILTDFQNKADLIIANGANFEKFISRVDLPADKLILTANVFPTNQLFHFSFVHSHGKEGKHSHIGINGHTWVDPIMARKQAAVIRDAIIKLDPAHKDAYNKNYIKLCKKFNELDLALKAAVKNYKGGYILVNHPSYDYLAREYGLKIKDFGIHPDVMPEKKVFRKIIDFSKKYNCKYMLWEEMPYKKLKKVLKKEAGLDSIIFSPCENLPKNKNYFSEMKKNISNLKYVIDHL